MRIAKVDANQTEIVNALRKIGASVTSTAAQHKGFPDLVVGYKGVNYLMEIKDSNKPPSQRKLTPDQIIFHKSWNGQIAVVTSVQDAFDVLGVK